MSKPAGTFSSQLRWENYTSSKKILTDDLYYVLKFNQDLDKDIPFEMVIDCYARQGFETDGASVPGIFRFLIDNDGPLARGAVFHDALYRFKPVCRVLADSMAYQMWLDDENVPKWKAHVAYYVLRYFGWIGWYFWGKKGDK